MQKKCVTILLPNVTILLPNVTILLPNVTKLLLNISCKKNIFYKKKHKTLLILYFK